MNGLFGGFPLKYKTVFFRQLATMITSALPLDRAISTAGTGVLPQARAIGQSILAGNSFSKALAAYPYLFSEYEVAMIATGETSGTLDTQLNVLAAELEQTHQLVQSLKSKLLYPIFVAHFALFVPSLVVLVKDGVEPYLKMTLGLLIPIYLMLGFLWTGYRLGTTTGTFRYLIDTTLNLVPVLGSVLRLLALTRFTRALSHLVEAGTLPYQAFQVAARACGNSWVRSRLYTSYRRVGTDGKLSQMMGLAYLFPVTVTSLVESGEETGQLGPMLAKGAELLEMEYRARVNLVMTLLPVVMLLGVGGLVGFRVYKLMMATYAPIFDM
ncbi:MAG: type II secretion system F family protein [Candidatus Eremiobacteraeota bacterium]|nr:type II secretion system F family protein [Candidatus Eremiobacteraeota bacterium]MCW5870963.1 type II secretion system F family protein [Candidatus Eremiobacteraeota bacterium]